MLSLCYNNVNCNLQQGQCKFDHKSVGAAAAGIVQIPSGSEKEFGICCSYCRANSSCN